VLACADLAPVVADLIVGGVRQDKTRPAGAALNTSGAGASARVQSNQTA
jgi:hypothetical protein